MELVLKLKNNASKLLLAIMESRHDSENAERIIFSMSPLQLVEAAVKAYHEDPQANREDDAAESEIDEEEERRDEEEEGEINPKDVGHNIYILAHQLSQHNKGLSVFSREQATLY